MQESDMKSLIEGYLEAFDARDLEQCMTYFRTDATLDWQVGVYKGKPSIEEWHQDRFAADLKLVRLEQIRIEGSVAIVEVVVTSRRLKAWRLGSMGGKATVVFQDGKIKETKFAVKSINPQESWA